MNYQHLKSVKNRIGPFVLEFCQARKGQTFFIGELRDFIVTKTKAAPASPDRILRDLRQQGQVKYKVIARSKALYEVLPGW